MNILFLLGNGFDLNLGLKTSYQDFYNYYKKESSKNDNIELLKKDMFENFENWSDLELALGKYTKKINSLEEFDEIYEDIIEKLSSFLAIEDNILEKNMFTADKNNLYNDLLYPEDTIIEVNKNIIKSYKNRWSTNSWNVNIITFNYTKSIEKLLNYDGRRISLGKAGESKYLNEINHIHGYVDDKMVMGVNDVSQVSNIKFHENQDIKDALIKVDSNKACGHEIDSKCEQLIKSSNLICIFGSSLGETDKKWWNLVGNQLIRNEFKLIIFEKIEKIPQRIKHREERIRREKRNYFLDKTELSKEEKKVASKNIFIGLNTTLFSNIGAFEL